MSFKRFAVSLLIALPLLASCRSDESLQEPDVIDPMFRRYAALGNSITAGFQSAGINDSVQRRSYAVLLGAAMQTSFNYPRLNGGGCPAPYILNAPPTRGPTGSPTGCDLRVAVTGSLNNLAVPGNTVGNLISNFGEDPSAFDPLKTFFLGGRTELELMQQLHPTFVSVWIGNNDVLGAYLSSANAGNPALLTPVPEFEQKYDSVAAVIEASNPKGVILLGVANISVIPYTSSGATYWCLKNGVCPGVPQAAFPPNFTVNNNCAPQAVNPAARGDSIFVPWPNGVGLILASASPPFPATTLDCSVDNAVILPAEYAAARTAIAGYNAKIAAVAAEHNWAYFDPNPTLGALRANPAAIAPFPDITTVATTGRVGFGSVFSLDGVHPSSSAHRLIADSVASTINAFYGTNLPVPVCGTVACPAP
jgi:lysophospholipase L1-like esterase